MPPREPVGCIVCGDPIGIECCEYGRPAPDANEQKRAAVTFRYAMVADALHAPCCEHLTDYFIEIIEHAYGTSEALSN